MTRARQAFIVSGSAKGGEGGAQAREHGAYRLVERAFEILPASRDKAGGLVHGDELSPAGHAPGGEEAIGAAACAGAARGAAVEAVEERTGESTERREMRGARSSGAALRHVSEAGVSFFPEAGIGSPPEAGVQALPPVGSLRRAAGEAERFGILLHALLERLGSVDDPDDVAAPAHWRVPGFDEMAHRRALPIVRRLFTAPVLRPFFDPARYRRAWNELELTDGEGRLLRIDRLVDLGDALWVLDYKSSSGETARLDEYRAQVRGYCRALAEIFPGRRIHGALVFADAGLLEVV